MDFNIPMNSRGALDSSSLLSQYGGQNSGQSLQTGQQNNGFGGQQNNGFGGQQNNGFGGQQNNGFGGQQNNGFGGQQNNGFGGQQNNGFGNQQNNGFGGQQNNGFGGQQNNGFGGQQNNGFGGQQNNGFGGQQNNGFGGQPNNGFGGQQNNGFNAAPPPAPAPVSAPAPRQTSGGQGVHLKKGQKFALAGQNGQQLQRIRMGLGWDVLNVACDLDASAFMLGQNNRIVGDDWFVFYGQTTSPDGSIVHSGDSQGAGSGDDETIEIDLNRVSPNVQKVAFVVTIDEALTRGQNFSMVANAYVRIIDAVTNAEIARFNLTDYYSNVTAMVVGELYRHNGTWKFNPVGDGVSKDLAGLCAMYGVNVAD